jgi:hypothetical protein
MKKVIDMPAFPRPAQNNPLINGQPGMSLRDYFAAAALQGYIGSSRLELETLSDDAEETVSKICYQFADAMMRARE